MPVTIGIPRETADGERRVAIVPEVAKKLTQLGARVIIQRGAGDAAYVTDELYDGLESVEFVEDSAAVHSQADFVFRINAPTPDEVAQMKPGAALIGAVVAHKNLDSVRALAQQKVTSWATDLIPRITRAQSMDTLSSQAAIAGYYGVLLASTHSSKFFPMLTTAAGTIRPAKVLVLGAGVAGLQAIATAKRLGAMVEAYDIRPETREQCESLGAKFIDTGIDAAGEGGYARELTDEEKAKQKEIVDQHIAKSDTVVTTAAIPGRPSPKLIDAAAASAMKPGSVIIDLASEGGGNCELTQPGQTITHNNMIIVGPLNVPANLAVHASEMFSKNLFNFISPFIEEGELKLDWEDEIISKACLTYEGEVRHEPTRKLLEENA